MNLNKCTEKIKKGENHVIDKEKKIAQSNFDYSNELSNEIIEIFMKTTGTLDIMVNDINVSVVQVSG